MSKVSNYPSSGLSKIETGTCAEVVDDLMELNARGKPQDVSELKARLTSYFSFCQQRDFRPGIESLALSLGVSRVMFWRWCQGDGCSREWSEICQNARQVVVAFVEQVSLKGKLNPATAIFTLKQFGWSDSVTIEQASKPQPEAINSMDFIMKKYGISETDNTEFQSESEVF